MKFTPLFTRADIDRRVKLIADLMRCDLDGHNRVTFLVVLNGAVPFSVDLLRALDRKPADTFVSYVSASSYHGGTLSGGPPVIIGLDLDAIIAQPVVIVEDIVDTGRTLAAMIERVRGTTSVGPTHVYTAALLDKPGRRLPEHRDLRIDWNGFKVEADQFVVGYGLDYLGLYRSDEAIRVLNEEKS